MTDHAIKRNHQGRPWIMEPGVPGPIPGEPRSNASGKEWWYTNDPRVTTYGRMSKAAEGVDSKEGLIPWAAVQAAIGMIVDKSARSEVISILNDIDDPWNDTKHFGKKRIMAAVEQGRETAGRSIASSAGTEFHGIAAIILDGRTPKVVQDHLIPLVDEFQNKLIDKGFEWIRFEDFVVNDEIKRCGSTDYHVRLPDGFVFDDPNVKGGKVDLSGAVVTADLKTGKRDPEFPISPMCQLAGYSHAKRYDQETNVRKDIHPDHVSEWGILVHFPILTEDPKVKLYPLDLVAGLEMCHVSNKVMQYRKAKNLKEVVLQ